MIDIDSNHSECVLIRQLESSSNTIINGIRINSNKTVLACPSCGRVIIDLGDNTKESEATKWCDSNNEALLKQNAYCPSCGQKLKFPKLLNIEFEVKNNNE